MKAKEFLGKVTAVAEVVRKRKKTGQQNIQTRLGRSSHAAAGREGWVMRDKSRARGKKYNF